VICAAIRSMVYYRFERWREMVMCAAFSAMVFQVWEIEGNSYVRCIYCYDLFQWRGEMKRSG